MAARTISKEPDEKVVPDYWEDEDPPPRRCCVKLRFFARRDKDMKGSLVQARNDPVSKDLDLEAADQTCPPAVPQVVGLVPSSNGEVSIKAIAKEDLGPEAPGDVACQESAAPASDLETPRTPQRLHTDTEEEFFSCDEAAIIEAVAPRAPSRSLAVTPATTPVASPRQAGGREEREPAFGLAAVPERQLRPKVPAVNKNRIAQYRWLEELLRSIVLGSSDKFARASAGPFCSATPLFVVAGACPNSVCGISTPMQAVLFNQVEGGGVDFWWIKPQKQDPNSLEQNTLRLHSKGPFKNDPGRSKPIYKPLADKFSGGKDGDFEFGVNSSGRAFIEEVGEDGRWVQLQLYLVWQESWSGVFESKKFIRGKVFYQKAPAAGAPAGAVPADGSALFAREYEIREGRLSLASAADEESVPSLLPPDHFQEMYATFG